MTERQKERIEIIELMIGHISGYGETNYDKKSLENLDFLKLFLEDLRSVLWDNAVYDGQEGSMLAIKEKSVEIYKDFYNDILILGDFKNGMDKR